MKEKDAMFFFSSNVAFPRKQDNAAIMSMGLNLTLLPFSCCSMSSNGAKVKSVFHNRYRPAGYLEGCCTKRKPSFSKTGLGFGAGKLAR